MNGQLAAASAGAVTLAELVCLAARVDPLLLRRARLALAPELTAGDEADLWLSPLVSGRSRAGFALEPAIVDELRERLAAEPARLAAAWAVTREAHAHLPPTVRLQERVTWLALSGHADAELEMECELESAVRVMHDDAERSRGIARWALDAVPALPARAQQSAAGRRLSFGATARMQPATEETRHGVALARVAVELTPAGVRLHGRPGADDLTIEIPAAPPLAVHVRVRGVQVRAKVPSTVPLGEVRALEATIGTVDFGAFASPVERVAVAGGSTFGVAVACRDGTIHYRKGGDPGSRPLGKLDHVAALAIDSERGRVVAGGRDGAAIWRFGAQTTLLEIPRPVGALAYNDNGELLVGLEDGELLIFPPTLDEPSRSLGRLEHPVVALGASPDRDSFVALDAAGEVTLARGGRQDPYRVIGQGRPGVAVAFMSRGDWFVVGGDDVTVRRATRPNDVVDRLGLPILAMSTTWRSDAIAVLTRERELVLWSPGAPGARRLEHIDGPPTTTAISLGEDGAVAYGGAPAAVEIETSIGDVYTLEAIRAEPEAVRIDRDLIALLELPGYIALAFHVSRLAPRDMDRETVDQAYGRILSLDPRAYDAIKGAAEWALTNAADVIAEGGESWRSWLKYLVDAEVRGFHPEMEFEEAVAAYLAVMTTMLNEARERLDPFEVAIQANPARVARARRLLQAFPLNRSPRISPASGFDARRQDFSGPFAAVVDVFSESSDLLHRLLFQRNEAGRLFDEQRRRAVEALNSPRPEEAVDRAIELARRSYEDAEVLLPALARLIRSERPFDIRNEPGPLAPHIERALEAIAAGAGHEQAVAALDLSGTDLRSRDFVNARLPQADLSRAGLAQANFGGADLTGATLRGVNATYANFDRARLVDANLRGASLEGCDFNEAVLDGASVAGAGLENARLTGARLLGADLRGVGGAVTGRGVVLHGAVLDGAGLSGSSLPGADFRAASCMGASFSGVELVGATFDGADVGGANFTEADLSGASFVGARLNGANLTSAKIDSATRFSAESDLSA